MSDAADGLSPREVMEYDVLIVGAGPAGLASAIRLKQLATARGAEVSVCVIDKGAEVGAHILSGAVMEPRALDELLPDWRNSPSPITVKAGKDTFSFLTAKHSIRLPTPPTMNNHGNYIVSLGEVARWLAEQAESLGVEIYPGFAAAEVLYNESGAVVGIATGDAGVGKDGKATPRFTRGVELRARQTLFAEGCRGSLTKTLFERFNLRDGVDPQTYGIGLKEVWEIDPAKHAAGTIRHTIGWPLSMNTYGGSFIYHMAGNLLAIGFVVGLDYSNTYLSPFEEFQRFKQHPVVKSLLTGGKRLSYGARALSEGGFQSIPRLTFAGGMLIGDAAGLVNVPKIKGIHTAMKSGMIAAEAIDAHLAQGGEAVTASGVEITAYRQMMEKSWIWPELRSVRNIRPSFHYGLLFGMGYSALDSMILRGHMPWTFHNHDDHACLKPAAQSHPIVYAKPDGVISFDRLSSVYLSGARHEEDQPCHLQLKRPELAIDVNLNVYDSPESRYCPAGVYEIVRDADGSNPRLVINASNCVHCKTCDIKDPTQNINWVTPEGGGGPNYRGM